MKKIFYRIDVGEGRYWICSEFELKKDILDWLNEYNQLTISEVKMTQEKFEAMPEFEG